MLLIRLIFVAMVMFPMASFADFAGREGQYLDNKGGMIYDVDSIDYSVPGRVTLNLSSGGDRIAPVVVIIKADKVEAIKSIASGIYWFGCLNASPGETCQLQDGFLSAGFGAEAAQLFLRDL